MYPLQTQHKRKVGYTQLRIHYLNHQPDIKDCVTCHNRCLIQCRARDPGLVLLFYKKQDQSCKQVQRSCICTRPQLTQRLAEINHPHWRHLPELPHDRKEQLPAIPTAPNYKAVDTVTARLSGNFPLTEYYFRIAIYSSHWTKLVVFQPFARPSDSDHCAVCTLLLERLYKYSVFHNYVTTNKSTFINMFNHIK